MSSLLKNKFKRGKISATEVAEYANAECKANSTPSISNRKLGKMWKGSYKSTKHAYRGLMRQMDKDSTMPSKMVF